MEIVDQIKQARVIAIVRGNDPTTISAIAAGLLAGGVTAIEITLNTPGAVGAIAQLSANYADRMLIGAGTVLSAVDVAAVVKAGARFIVAPETSPDVIRASLDHEVEPLPGALTPTEIMQAYRAGARLIKLFPAMLGGPDYLRQVRAPLDMVEFIPTGGVEPSNARAYFEAGAVAIGAGGALVPKSFDGSAAAIAELSRRAEAYMTAAR